jgi:hypothetical protein
MLHERQPPKATRVEVFDAEIAAFHDLNPIKYIALSFCCCLHQGSFRILLSKLQPSKSQPRCQPFPTSTSTSVHVTSPKTTTSKLNGHCGPRPKVLLQPLDHQYDPEYGKRLEKRCRPVPSASRYTRAISPGKFFFIVGITGSDSLSRNVHKALVKHKIILPVPEASSSPG